MLKGYYRGNNLQATIIAAFITSIFLICDANAADLTVTGLRIGMSEVDAKAALGTSFAYTNVPTSDSSLAELSVVNSDKTDDYALSFVDDKLFFINHFVEYATGKEPTMASLRNQLLAKYGNKFDQGGADQFYWVYDENLDPIASPIASNCERASQAMTINQNFPGPGQALALPTQFVDGCGMSAYALTAFDRSNPELVKYLNIKIDDDALVVKHLKALQERGVQKRHQEIDKAQANTPRL